MEGGVPGGRMPFLFALRSLSNEQELFFTS